MLSLVARAGPTISVSAASTAGAGLKQATCSIRRDQHFVASAAQRRRERQAQDEARARAVAEEKERAEKERAEKAFEMIQKKLKKNKSNIVD